MDEPEPDQRRPNFGVPRAVVRWWPVWILLIVVVIVLMSVLPSLVGAGPAIGTGPTNTAATTTTTATSGS